MVSWRHRVYLGSDLTIDDGSEELNDRSHVQRLSNNEFQSKLTSELIKSPLSSICIPNSPRHRQVIDPITTHPSLD